MKKQKKLVTSQLFVFIIFSYIVGLFLTLLLKIIRKEDCFMEFNKIEMRVLSRANNNDLVNGVLTIPGGVSFVTPGSLSDCSELKSIKFQGNANADLVMSVIGEELNGVDFEAQLDKDEGERLGEKLGFEVYDDILLKRTSGCYIANNSLVRVDREAIIDGKLFVPNGVEKVAKSLTINGSCDLKEVFLPEGVSTIEHRAFSNCYELQIVHLPSSLKCVGWLAFSGCTNLESVVLPENLNELGVAAFLNCKKLHEVNIPGGIDAIKKNTFSGCSSLESVSIQEGVKKVDGSAFSSCRNLREVKLTGSLKRIEPGTFGLTKLERVSIPSGVEYIGNSAFTYCKELKSVEIPESVELVGDSAFFGCIKLEECRLPSKARSVEPSTFQYCKSLKHVEIPEGVVSIKNSAFYGCESLESVSIPTSTRFVEERAFLLCKELRNVEFKGNRDEVVVDSTAFTMCPNEEYGKLSKLNEREDSNDEELSL